MKYVPVKIKVLVDKRRFPFLDKLHSSCISWNTLIFKDGIYISFIVYSIKIIDKSTQVFFPLNNKGCNIDVSSGKPRKLENTKRVIRSYK